MTTGEGEVYGRRREVGGVGRYRPRDGSLYLVPMSGKGEGSALSHVDPHGTLRFDHGVGRPRCAGNGGGGPCDQEDARCDERSWHGEGSTARNGPDERQHRLGQHETCQTTRYGGLQRCLKIVILKPSGSTTVRARAPHGSSRGSWSRAPPRALIRAAIWSTSCVVSQ